MVGSRKKKKTLPSPSVSRSRSRASSSNTDSNDLITNFYICAAIAGFCGAMVGVCGKVGVSETASLVAAALLKLVGRSGGGAADGGDSIVLVADYSVRAVMIFANIFFTGQMWRFYLRALARGPTTMCQVVSTGTNFAVSALVGMALFGEQIGLLWVVGAAIAGVGFVLLKE